MRLQCKLVVAVLITTASLGVEAQSSPQNQELARSYMELRSGLFLQGTQQIPGAIPSDFADSLDVTARVMARGLKSSSDWNPNNPAWPTVLATIRADLQKTLEKVAADPRVAESSAKVQEILLDGIAHTLTESELRGLVEFYGSPLGTHYSKVYDQMTVEFARGQPAMVEAASEGRRLGNPPTAGPEQAAMQEILGLFDESYKMRLGMVDPGPGKDRSGLQALGFIIVGALQARFTEINRLWHQLDDDERRRIVAFRQSELAKRERAAIFEAAKGLQPMISDPNGIVHMQGKALEDLNRKWRALIPN